MKGFIFSLPPCECILSGERRSGVTAWPLIGRHQPVEKVRMMHGALGTMRQLERSSEGRSSRMSRQGRRFESCRSNSSLTEDHPPILLAKRPVEKQDVL